MAFPGVVAMAFALGGAVSWAQGAAGREADARSPGFTVIPPGPVSDKISVELRLGLRAPGSDRRSFVVEFVVGDGACERPIARRLVTLAAGRSRAVRAWWSTEGQAGCHTLRYRVLEHGRLLWEGDWPIEVIACETPALPVLQGMWYDPALLRMGKTPASEQSVRESVRAIARLGIRIIIITYVESSGGSAGGRSGEIYYPSKIRRDYLKLADLGFDPVGAILSEADARGMHVFIGNGRGGDLYLLWNGFGDTERMTHALELGREMAQELWDLYGRHRSFYGWYFTHEMDDLAKAGEYYNPLADFCHSLAPDKPVLIAPAGAPIVSPQVLRASRVDILAYQDSVGYGYRNYQNTWDPEQRLADLDDIYARYRAAHRGTSKHIWSDLEIWRGVPEPTLHTVPAPMGEVERQIAIESRHVDLLTAYTYQMVSGDMPPWLPSGANGTVSAKLYDDLLGYATATMEKLRSGQRSGRAD